MKIGVTNVVLSNTGDAAIFHGIKAVLDHDQGCQIVAFDSHAATTTSLYPGVHVVQQLLQVPWRAPRWRFIVGQGGVTVAFWVLSCMPRVLRIVAAAAPRVPGRLARSLSELASCDVIVSTGGTYLVDHYEFTHRYVELRCARALKKPVVLWTQSLGPFGTRRSRWLAERIARLADAVYCRDRRSADEWRTATGWDGKLAVVPDTAFAIEQVPTTDQGSEALPPCVALSVREWRQGVDGRPLEVSRYVTMMQAAAATLASLGWRCLAISTCQGLPTYGYDDGAVALRIFSEHDVQVDTDFHTPAELLEVLAGCRLVVTTRMHFAILALISRVPVIAVAYEFKTVELLESLGLAHAVVRIEDSSPEWMRAAAKRAVADPDAFRLTRAQLERLREDAAIPAGTVIRLAGPATNRHVGSGGGRGARRRDAHPGTGRSRPIGWRCRHPSS